MRQFLADKAPVQAECYHKTLFCIIDFRVVGEFPHRSSEIASLYRRHPEAQFQQKLSQQPTAPILRPLKPI